MENKNTQRVIPEKDELVLKKGMPIAKLLNDISKLHIGDKVQIPRQLLPADSTVSEDDYVDAVIEAIYRHHIAYRLKPGTRISLDYFDSLQVFVTDAFSSYPEEQQLLDLANAMAEK